MLPAFTIEDIKKFCNCFGYDTEKRMIGIMIARYSLRKSERMIKEQYNYWHNRTDDNFHVFWIGYGAYGFEEKKDRIFIGRIGEVPNVFFDTDVFVKQVEEIKKHLNRKIHDEIGLLLCDYYNEKLYWDESVFFRLNSLMKDDDYWALRDFTDYLIELSKNNKNVAAVKYKLKIKYFILEMKLNGWINTIIQIILSIKFPLFK